MLMHTKLLYSVAKVNTVRIELGAEFSHVSTSVSLKHKYLASSLIEVHITLDTMLMIHTTSIDSIAISNVLLTILSIVESFEGGLLEFREIFASFPK
jgi:hypothetical protein